MVYLKSTFFKWLTRFIGSQITLMKNLFIDYNNSCLLNPFYIFPRLWTVVLFQNINNWFCYCLGKDKDKITMLYCVISNSNMSEIRHHGLHTAQIIINEWQNSVDYSAPEKRTQDEIQELLTYSQFKVSIYVYVLIYI